VVCGKGRGQGVYTAEDQARLMAAVLDQWIADVKIDPARQNGRKRREEACEVKRQALADLRHLRRHPDQWGVLAFLCEHTDLPPKDVVRGLWLRAGLPWQTEMRLLEAEPERKRWAA
jgi:hypothetical protein